jgi:hypothetical protein
VESVRIKNSKNLVFIDDEMIRNEDESFQVDLSPGQHRIVLLLNKKNE